MLVRHISLSSFDMAFYLVFITCYCLFITVYKLITLDVVDSRLLNAHNKIRSLFSLSSGPFRSTAFSIGEASGTGEQMKRSESRGQRMAWAETCSHEWH
jgi:hypothetical protein